MRTVQLSHPARGSRVALVDEPHLRLLTQCSSIYELATKAIQTGRLLRETIEPLVSDEKISYEAVHQGQSDWRLKVPVDHPEPSRCFVSGTGLTHKASAQNRQSMHVGAKAEPTDSAKMFEIGLAGGRPAPGHV